MIEFAERALRGEVILPDWREAAARPEYARGPQARLTDSEVDSRWQSMRTAFPELEREWQFVRGEVQDVLEKAGYTGEVPADVQASVLPPELLAQWQRKRAERGMIVFAERMLATPGKAPRLMLHELGHRYWESLPVETQEALSDLWRQEVTNHTGPLFDANGDPATDIRFLPEDFDAEELKNDPDLPLREWFAERLAQVNAGWANGRISSRDTLLARVAFDLREIQQRIQRWVAQAQGRRVESALLEREFRRFLRQGAKQLDAKGQAVAVNYAREGAPGQGQVDFSRRGGEAADHAEPAADSPDPFTGQRTFITGSRVSAAQALRIAERSRQGQIRAAKPDTGATRGVAPAEFHPLGLFVDADELVNGRTGRRLPRLSNGTGAEAEAFHDEAHGVVYKVFKQGGNGSIGNRLVIDQDGMALLDAGTERDVAEKVWVLNELGGVPTEIVGYTADGELMVKQPLGQRGSVDAKKTRPANRAVNRAANLVAIPARILARPNQWKGGLHYSNINGAHVLIDDLHAGNYVGDTMGRGRILDLATHVLTADEIARQPSLREWIHAQQEQARATGPAEFARRRQDGKSKPPTETPAFKEWFGDSQVVDAAGRPLVVYHGTNADISAFDPGRLGQNKAAPARIGFWFADDPLYAANHGEAIMPVYLRALKPYIVQGDTLQALANDPQGLQRIKDAGYDAIWQPAKADMLGKTKVRTAGIIAVFSPTQIKSATGNRGTFDAANPRIDYARKRKNPRDAKVVQAELDQVQQQIDGLKESQEEQADIEARGAELTKKQAALQKELVRAKRDDQVAASLKPLHDIDDRVDPLSGAVIVPSIVPMDRKAALRQKFTPDRLFQQPANHAFSCMSPAELGA